MARTTEYQYDADHHLIGKTDPLGNQSHRVIYDAFGRAEMSIRKDGSVVTFNPVQVQGLQPSGGPFNPFAAPAAGTDVGSYTDGDGHVTDVTFDYAGYIVAQADGEGTVSTSQLDSNFQPTADHRRQRLHDPLHLRLRRQRHEQSYRVHGQHLRADPEPRRQLLYTFQGTPGQTFFYDGLTASSPDINAQLLDPAGNQVFYINASTNSGLVTLEAAGTYQLIIAGQAGRRGLSSSTSTPRP